jgi:hypothetical protein
MWKRALVLAAGAVALAGGSSARAQMVSGERMTDFGSVFNVKVDQRSYPFNAVQADTSIPANILFPGDQPTWTIQLQNLGGEAIRTSGKIDVIQYGTRGEPGEIWIPTVFKIGDAASVPVDINLPAHGFQNVTVNPKIPDAFGGYGVVADLGDAGRRFVFSAVRTFKPTPLRIQYPSLSLDDVPGETLPRLGIQAVRHGISWWHLDDPQSAKKMAQLDADMQDDMQKHITVLLMSMAGENDVQQPLGRPRPHLDDQAVMLQTKSDFAWLPSEDDAFEQWVNAVTSKYGWPKGPVTAMSLWNEPWEGISISGWGADMLRYRDIFRHMAAGVLDARKNAGVQVLLAGCDSSSNTIDKLFPDDTDEFLPLLDVCTIHYQGMSSPSTFKKWLNRGGPNGRVKIWDTESWVANVDDRVAAVVAANRSAGYDRAMGVFGGNVSDHSDVLVTNDAGKKLHHRVDAAWSTAASVGAAVHFIGERPFEKLLFQNGLPWVMVFDGQSVDDAGKVTPNPEDGTLVVVGDIGEEFGKNGLLHRTITGLTEVDGLKAAEKKLADLPADAPAADRLAATKAVAALSVIHGGTMVLDDGGGKFSLYDFYGNPVPSQDHKITVPLDGRGFFLRGDGSPGSFAALQQAVAGSRLDGFECLELQPHDLLATVDTKPTLRVTCTNVLNRPITGKLAIDFGKLRVENPGDLSFAAGETRDVDIKVTGGNASADNTYPLSLKFDAGADGFGEIQDKMHVNVIAHRTITVDGKLDDWKGVLPQTIVAQGTAAPTMQEAAWFPFQKFDSSVKTGFATGYLAYDDNNFYFAAKVADPDPDAGTMRFETRDDDQFFYPDVAYELDPKTTIGTKPTPAKITNAIRIPFAPQMPGSMDRNLQVLDAMVSLMKVDIHLPAGEPQQVALYFVDNDDHEQGRQVNDITVADAQTHKKLASGVVKEFGSGTYAVFNAAGDVEVTIQSHITYQPTGLAAVFIDAADSSPAGADARGTGTKGLGLDEHTAGNWQGVYGKSGYLLVGQPPHFADGVAVDFPQTVNKKEHVWPEGVRHYSYREKFVLPAGNAPNFDNVQIAFNAIPLADDPVVTASPPGTPPMYTAYRDTDYQYALNKVADQYGGGTEIWRLQVPDHMRTGDFPRQPKAAWVGAVKDGKLAVVQDGATRITEVAIPWSEIPDVKKLLDGGKTVKFDFRVNDHTGLNGMELAWGRGASRENNGAFSEDWIRHWANELEFAFDKSDQAPAK